MTRGKVVLVPFPFDDLSAAKVRPAVCLTNPIGPYRHVVLAFITSQIPPDLAVTTSLIQRELGEVSPRVQLEIFNKLRHLIE